MINGKITKKRFFEIMECLDKKLAENNIELSINIYGGTAMMVCFDIRSATKDIDALFDTSPQLNNILSDIAEMYDLDSEWINQAIKEPLKHLKTEDLKVLYRFNNLKIFAPSAEQMLAMKILSSRPEPYKDFEDAEFLIQYLKIDDLDNVIKIFDKYAGRKYLGDRQKIFLNYIGKDLNKRWEEFKI
ncbi:MAG: ABC transporter substrate-binding protein [Sedimentibacter sp.]|nr:ABC transporter substrate-binding protein [Sedimentibacter sp.]